MFKSKSLSFFVMSFALGGCQGQLNADLINQLNKEIEIKVKVQPTIEVTASPTLNPAPQPTVVPTTTPPQPIPTSMQPIPSPQPTVLPSATPPQPIPTSMQPIPVPQPSGTVKPTPLPTPLPTPMPTATPLPTPSPTVTPSLTTPLPSLPGKTGLNASLDFPLFPSDNAWNQAIDQAPIDPNSDQLIASIGLDKNLHPDFGSNWNGGPFGIPYYVVDEQTPGVPIHYTAYGSESDPGPFPIPANAPIEGGAQSSGDRHILVVDRQSKMLYELFYAFPNSDGSYNASSGAVFNLSSNALRPAGWTSADAAGLPILPGLVRYDEVVEKQVINHALRFTASRTRRAYTHPARHFASQRSDPSLPPMGMRVRLKASFDISGYAPEAQIILRALKTYGMILADNGSNWFVSGVADARWNDGIMNTLKQVKGRDFEVVKMGEIVTD